MLTKSITQRLFRPQHWLLASLLCGLSLHAVAEPLPSTLALAPTVAPLPTPEGRVMLTITGNIGVTNSGTNSAMGQADQAEFDLSLLDSFPQHEFVTETPWTEGAHRFSGVLLSDLLRRVDAKGSQVKAVAFNEYFAEINTRDPELSALLVTTRIDGQPMRIRDRGPTWLMLPLSELKQLNNKRYHELLIWQLRSLDVQ